jgi:hypothetical protein
MNLHGSRQNTTASALLSSRFSPRIRYGATRRIRMRAGVPSVRKKKLNASRQPRPPHPLGPVRSGRSGAVRRGPPQHTAPGRLRVGQGLMRHRKRSHPPATIPFRSPPRAPLPESSGAGCEEEKMTDAWANRSKCRTGAGCRQRHLMGGEESAEAVVAGQRIVRRRAEFSSQSRVRWEAGKEQELIASNQGIELD